ncbi:EexN family lipoprotein [Entomobacter blattae]|uniref:EexN family lipoprotein n=1 Tax=Entomobacter blattae TaxID=2762277 RepID=A0A7H1NP51_9PROT|nr:EexN family lipoprotein [Entomobacter blattae]QNT77561.1 hypothetical protein JGUZn3_03040 [Entomobacter blattae]
MKKITRTCALSLFTIPLLLSACEKKAQTKEWYTNHKEERLARIEDCKTDAEKMITLDCRNAFEANVDIMAFGKKGDTGQSIDITKGFNLPKKENTNKDKEPDK